jgi:hypothetical protein
MDLIKRLVDLLVAFDKDKKVSRLISGFCIDLATSILDK